MALQSALSGKHPPQHLPIGTLTGVIGRPLEIETGDGWMRQPVGEGCGQGVLLAAGDTVQLSDSRS